MHYFTALLLLILCSAPAAAQTPPPIQGVTGTIATDETIEAEHHAGNAIAEGVKRVADGAKKLFSFGGARAGNQNALDVLIEGARVVMRNAGDTTDASATEGTVIDVNRRRQQITIRLGDRKTQTLRLAAAGANGDVVVSYTDAAGTKATGDFTRVP